MVTAEAPWFGVTGWEEFLKFAWMDYWGGVFVLLFVCFKTWDWLWQLLFVAEKGRQSSLLAMWCNKNMFLLSVRQRVNNNSKVVNRGVSCCLWRFSFENNKKNKGRLKGDLHTNNTLKRNHYSCMKKTRKERQREN